MSIMILSSPSVVRATQALASSSELPPLATSRQEDADQTMELMREHGINHIDTAASYGDAELRLGALDGAAPRPLLPRHQDRRADLRGGARPDPDARWSGCASTTST